MLDIDKLNCAGCGACANICPSNAILMKENNEGFYVPFIDKEKCTNCGLCEKICPELNLIEKNTKTPDCYAVMAEDEIRKKSSSGGAFSVIAKEIFNRGGVVCGAAFDEHWVVRHIIIDNEDDMNKLRGSKYVQSFISEDLYKKLKGYLDADRWVLFTGTPCQVAGFKAFLRKDYEKLLLVDLLCSKVPPKKIFDKFLKDYYPNKKITDIQMRDKSNGWGCNFTTTTTTGLFKTNDWFRMFLSSLSMNESCVHCKYMSTDRISDITIGDFWKIGESNPKLDDKKGTSIILINTINGKSFFENLNWEIKESATLEQAIHGNRALLVPFLPHANRKMFAKKINNENFKNLLDNCLKENYNIGILNLWYNSNRGAILTCYALQETIKEFGYNPLVINYIYPELYNNGYLGSISDKFSSKYLHKTRLCHDYLSLKSLNKDIKTFIVGSDQVFRDMCVSGHLDKYFFNFVDEDAKKIACAASFGLPYYDGPENSKNIMSKYLNRFDYLSVRESSGVDVLKNEFDLDGIQILDPVFYPNKSKYENVIKDSSKTDKNYIAYYFIWETQEKKQAIEWLSKKLNIKAINIKNNLPVEDWLYYIKNSKLMFTDSFHGTCFSIIFRKTFITVSPYNNKSDDRLDYILELLELKDRQLLSTNEVYKREDLLLEIDYNKIDIQKLNKEIDRSKNWLLNSIESSKQTKEYSKDDKLFYAIMDRMNTIADYNKFFAKKLVSNVSQKDMNLAIEKLNDQVSLAVENYNNINKNYYTKDDIIMILNYRKYKIKLCIYSILSLTNLKVFKEKRLKYKNRVKFIKENICV